MIFFPRFTDVDTVEDGGPEGGSVEEDSWFGNTSDSPSESSYGDVQDELRVSPDNVPRPDHDTSAESSLGCPTPVQRASLELLGLDSGVLLTQDMLSSEVSSLYGDSSQALGKPLSSNLRRLLEAGSLKLEGGDMTGHGTGRGPESPPVSLVLSPSLHHAQQLSALARRLANSSSNNSGNSNSASPASVATVKQEPCDPYGNGPNSGSSGFIWVGIADKWPSTSCLAPSGSSLSPDSAIQKLKAAANAVLQDKCAVASSTSASSSSSSSSSSSVPSSSMAALGTRSDDAVRFEPFASPFSPQSASSTLAALSKKVSERSQQQVGSSEHQTSAGSFLSLVSMTSSAALLKEVAARAAGNLIADKKEPALVLGASEDVKPLLDRNQKVPTPTQAMDLLLPTIPKGRAKLSSQAGNGLFPKINACLFCFCAFEGKLPAG